MQFSLQKYIYETLSSDSEIQSLSNGVFDYAPQSVQHPFISTQNIK